MRKDTGRHALRYGLAASAILHLAILALNPGVQGPGTRPSPRVPAIAPDALRAVALAPDGSTAPAPGAVAERLVAAAGAARDSLARTPGGTPSAPGAVPGRSAPGDRSALARLAAPRDPTLWRPPVPAPETREEKSLRELAVRLEQARRQGEQDARARQGGGIRIPFGFRPPPPAQTVPAPPPLLRLASDSVRREGERVRTYHGVYSIALPATLTQGIPFELVAHEPAGADSALVRVFVDDAMHADAFASAGVARLTLRIESPGEHRIRVHFLGNAARPVEILHVIEVEAARGRP